LSLPGRPDVPGAVDPARGSPRALSFLHLVTQTSPGPRRRQAPGASLLFRAASPPDWAEPRTPRAPPPEMGRPPPVSSDAAHGRGGAVPEDIVSSGVLRAYTPTPGPLLQDRRSLVMPIIQDLSSLAFHHLLGGLCRATGVEAGSTAVEAVARAL